jgi:hypothetical protein
MKGYHQRKHTRHSVKGKTFKAGKIISSYSAKQAKVAAGRLMWDIRNNPDSWIEPSLTAKEWLIEEAEDLVDPNIDSPSEAIAQQHNIAQMAYKDYNWDRIIEKATRARRFIRSH